MLEFLGLTAVFFLGFVSQNQVPPNTDKGVLHSLIKIHVVLHNLTLKHMKI